jgi:MerR family transcriptional regulator, mercuric resistance operon regulatory protein
MPSLTIGRLADAAGVHVETVRYYQRRGLLTEPSRPLGGIRRYGDNDLAKLQFVRRARAMGFSLDEIAGLLKLDGAGACLHTRQLTESRLAEVRRKLQDLRRLESELVELVDTCKRSGADDCCPTLDRLQQ